MSDANNMGVTNNTPAPAANDQTTSDQTQQSQETLPQDQITPEAKKVAAVKEVEKKLKKLKLKVDGQEFEEEFDPNDDEYMTRQLQMAKAGQKRMGEHAQLQKEVKAFIDALKKDPRRVLSDPTIGVDVKKFAAQILEEEIENSKKSPEQLEKEQLEKELKALKEEREREKEENQQKDFQRLQDQAYERYDISISNAIEKSDLPKSPYVVNKIADILLLGLKNGLDVSAEDAMSIVHDDITNDIKQMFSAMPEEVIEKIVGKDIINKIRKKSIAKAKSSGNVPTPLKSSIKDVGAVKKEAKKEDAPKKNFKQFFGI